MIKCEKCLLPETYDTIEIADDRKSCNLCKASESRNNNTNWDKKKKQLDSIIEKYRGKYEYDCIIPFSGGKDSTYALYYLVNEYKLKPLVVRFDAGFMRPIQAQNINNVIRKLGVDYINFTPNWNVVKLLMDESFKSKTDFCWHCHTGIYAYPLRLAVKYNTPLVFWGESLDIMQGGYEFNDDSIDFEDASRFYSSRTLGVTADDMYNTFKSRNIEVDKRDLTPYTYPTVEELTELNYFSVCLGSFIPWDYRANTSVIKEKLGWVPDTEEGVPHELNQEGAKMECWLQATRDYIKFLKRGYGRVTQCVNFEIRNGRMTTEEGQKIIDEFEGRKPHSLKVFLEYIGMSEQTFNEIVNDAVVEPFKPDFNMPMAEKPVDFDKWYREIN